MLSDITRFVVAGDWHGNYEYAKRALFWASKQNAKVVIHVGDFFGAIPRYLAENYANGLNLETQRLGMTLYFIDGNHEPYPWLLGFPIAEDGTRPIEENVIHLPRTFRWEWEGMTFLAMGGAHSIDNQWRTAGNDWFHEEQITLAEAHQACNDGIVDIMFTHDAPDKVTIPGIDDTVGNNFFPIEDIATSEAHRRLIGSIMEEVQPLALFHGHFHERYHDFRPLENADWKTLVTGLDKDKSHFEWNMVVIDLTTREGLELLPVRA